MDNNNTTKGYTTANINDFKMEVISLLNKIRKQVGMESSDATVNQDKPNKKTATQLGILKIHEFKLNEIMEMLEGMETEGWIEYKQDFIKDFESAYEAFQPTIVK